MKEAQLCVAKWPVVNAVNQHGPGVANILKLPLPAFLRANDAKAIAIARMQNPAGFLIESSAGNFSNSLFGLGLFI
jgi:hypothetical protein